MDRPLGERELEVMEVVWERGDATVREVMEAFDDDRAYMTFLSFMRGLEEKGYLTHREEGRAYRYRPTTSRKEVQAAILHQVIQQVFDSRPDLLLTRLLEVWEPSKEERQEARNAICRGSAAEADGAESSRRE